MRYGRRSDVDPGAVQAKGGKFLADDIGGAEVVIRDAQTGRWLGGGLANGTDSGTLSDAYSAAASRMVIVTPATEAMLGLFSPEAAFG